MRFFLPLLCIGAAAMPLVVADEGIAGIPHKPDPPIAVDGDLGEWGDVPGRMVIATEAHVVWGPGAWSSPGDLSGTARLAWRRDNLFLAVEATDDVLAQTERGAGIWRGDHVELYLDVQPDLEPERGTFGPEVFQLAFSPGNFQSTGDAFEDCPPEAFRYLPEPKALPEAEVASSRTEQGWTLEAAIPWEVLGIGNPSEGFVLRFEVAISDTDSQTPQQESMMTASANPWTRVRSRLTMAVLAGSDGVPPPLARKIEVFDALMLERGKSQSLNFEAPPLPEGKEAYLSLQARLHSRVVAGHTPALYLELNGTPLDYHRLQNKPLRAKARDGRISSMAAGERFTTFYTPGYDKPDLDPRYGLLGGIKACAFDLLVTDLVQEGSNTLLLAHRAASSVDNPLHAAEGAISFRPPPPPPKPKAGPPSGPLEQFTPRQNLKTDFHAEETPEGRIVVTVVGERFEVVSRFSSPEPAWVHGGCTFFDHQREISKGEEAIVVRDTFTNRTDEPLGIMQRHEADFGDRMKQAWCGGLEQVLGGGKTNSSNNCTSFARTEAAGLGLVALSDAFRIHTANYVTSGTVGLADNNLVLPPGATHTAEWAIVPVEIPTYWRFINAARRLMGANFLIDGGFAFLRASPETDAWSDEQLESFIRFKDAYYVCSTIAYPRYKGHYSHGTSFQHVPHDSYRNSFEHWRTLVPESRYLVYFHCFLDALDDSPERFHKARTLRADGTQADYGKSYMKLFFPTAENGYGPAVEKNVDIILGEIGADGVYWDEHEYSRSAYHYGEAWDRCSGDIDPRTMRVSRLKSSVTLLTEAWRVALAEKIMAHGPLVGNGTPITRAMTALEFPCFVETGSITNCTRSHLYSPIALGDHLTERSEKDAHRVMLEALDYGCVYHWYGDLHVVPTHPHLTRYMFPITPMELHEGFIIGEERIVTKKSGLYGWGDSSKHKVHVFDDTGTEAPGFSAPFREIEGNTYTELRLAEDWSAAIVRR